MRFGVLTLPTVAWDDLLRRWQYLDELGFDAIYVADGLAHPLDPSRQWLDGWMCVAAAAQVTQRARIGTLVTSIIFRRPAEIVHAAVTLDRASGGRAMIGIGAGDSQIDHELAEVPDWPPAERAQRLRDYAARVRSLLDGERIPLTIAAQAPKGMRVAAAYADTWNTYGARRLSPEEGRVLVRRLVGEFDRAVGESGRRVERSILIGDGFIREQPFASEDAFVEVVDAWRDIGMDEIVFFDPGESDVVERIAREVMPSCS